jgi:hypothetical protein
VTDLAKFWLGDCIAGHSNCRQLISGSIMDDSAPIMPTYVIDVGRAAGNNLPGQGPQLLHTKNGISGQYAALSHVWGNGQYTVQTTMNNVIHMQQNIDLHSIESTTLNDAMSITRSLGIPYLWIDSLCIIQDGPGYDAECARMGQIYENAAVVIAATGAANDHVGCYLSRSKSKQKPVQFTNRNEDGSASHYYITVQAGSLAQDADAGIWASRSWLLEERILARRTLHFAREQLYWECASMIRSEDGVVVPKGNPKRLFYGSLDQVKLLKTKDPAGQDAMLCYQRWCLLVAEFTQRTLSNANDKLDALAGIATEITNRTGGTYLAGHWQDYLQIGLLWQAKSVRLQIPDNPLAPTWSWASRHGPIFHDPYLFNAVKDDKYTIVSENTSIQKDDVHGKAVTGSIQLSGKMKPVTKMEGGIADDKFWNRISTQMHEYFQDRELLSALVQDDGTPVGWGSFDTVDLSHVDTDTRDVWALCVSKNVPVAPSSSAPTSAPSSPVLRAASSNATADANATTTFTPTFNVLLLKATTDEGKTFQRVGMGEITTNLWFDDVEVVSVTLE